MVTSRADIAEWVKRVDTEEDIRPGMVVGWVVGRGISLSTAGADKLGVVSSTLPGYAGLCHERAIVKHSHRELSSIR